MHTKKLAWTTVRRALLLGASVLAFAGAAFAQDQTKSFDVQALPASSGIPEFAREANIQILVSEDEVRGKKTNAVHGDLSVHEALRQLLAGTGISVSSDDGHTITLSNGDLSKKIRAASDEGAANVASQDIETVVVTGTNIRGIENPTAPLQTYDRAYIENSGYTDTQDFIRSLPQNFGGGSNGASEDGILGSGFNAGTNNEAGSAVNLRGLGENSTLVLLNGHRMAPSDFGSFVDVSSIPLSAIDHVDVLTDGASAIYGADAVAGVVNFVLKHDYEGAQTSLTYGHVTDGSFGEHVVGQTYGRTWTGGAAMASVEYHDQSAPPTSERSFTAGALSPTDILPSFVKYSALLSGHQDFGDRFEVYSDILLNRDNISRAFTPSTFASTKTFTDTDTENVSAGMGYEPFADWRLDLSGTYSREHTTEGESFDTNPPFGYVVGTVAVTNTSTTASGEAKANGTIFSLPGGDAKAAVGASYRAEDFRSFVPYLSLLRPFHRHITSEFGEIYVPIIGASNELPFVQRLDISAAVRHDNYSDFGGTTNPKIGALWSPSADIDIRGSWGTSFRAPDASELINQHVFGESLVNFDFTAPSGVGTVPVFILTGTSQNLRPESSKNWTVGFDLHPRVIPSGNISFNYYSVDYSNRIISPPFDIGALQQPQVYGSLITPLADDAAAAAYLANFVARGGTFFDILGTGAAGVRYIYADQEQNAAVVRQSGFDIVANYSLSLGASTLAARGNVSVINQIDTAFTSSSLPTNLANTYGNPLHLRARGDLTWLYRGWTVNGAINFSNRYVDTSAFPHGVIGAWTTFDLNVRYETSSEALPIFEGTSLSLSITNLFDSPPPFANGSFGLPGVHYDVGNASPVGRFVAIKVEKSW